MIYRNKTTNSDCNNSVNRANIQRTALTDTSSFEDEKLKALKNKIWLIKANVSIEHFNIDEKL